MSIEIYQTPETDSSESVENVSLLGKSFAVLGAIMAAELPIGFAATVVSLVAVFNDISLHGTGDPKFMAGGISAALDYTVPGLVLTLPGIMLMALAITVFKYREIWLY